MPSPRYWRERASRYRLEAGKCEDCGKVVFPPRRVCPTCRGKSWEPVTLSRRGTIITYTVIHVPPEEFLNEAPYVIAVVETPEGARLTAQVVDCGTDAIEPGTEVSLEFRLIRREGHGGILCYGHKGVPVG